MKNRKKSEIQGLKPYEKRTIIGNKGDLCVGRRLKPEPALRFQQLVKDFRRGNRSWDL